MKEKNEDVVELNLVELFHYLKKRFWILLAAFAVFAFGGFFYTQVLSTPQYTASSTAFVLSNVSGSGTVYQDIQISTYMIKDYEVLVTSRSITESVAKELKLDMTYQQLAGKITVTVPENTRTLQIEVTDSDPQRAADIANTTMKYAAKMIKDTMRMEAVNVVDTAIAPENPSSPGALRNTVLFAVIGLVLAIGVLTVIFILDDSIRTEEDVERYLGLPTIGVIPMSNEIAVTPAPGRQKKPAATDAKRK